METSSIIIRIIPYHKFSYSSENSHSYHLDFIFVKVKMSIFESLDLDEHEVQMKPERTTVTTTSMSGMLAMRNEVSLDLFLIASIPDTSMTNIRLHLCFLLLK